KRLSVAMIVEVDYRTCSRRGRTRCRNNRITESVCIPQVQFADQTIRRTFAIWTRSRNPREQTSRTNDGRQEAPGRDPVAKVEPVHEQPLHAQKLRQGTHHVVESLAHQNDVRSPSLQNLQAA